MANKQDPVKLDLWDIIILAFVGLAVGIMLIQVGIRYGIFFK